MAQLGTDRARAVFGLLLGLSLAATSGTALAVVCDINGDGAIDRNDISAIVAARNTLATTPTDNRDADGDGKINVLDARICATRCSLSSCAVAATLPSTAEIGLAGGAIGLPDGARLDVPAGALARNVSVSIKEVALPPWVQLPENSAAVSKFYELTPNGQTFLQPVTLTLPVNLAVLPQGMSFGDISIFVVLPNGRLGMVGDASQDPEEAESAGQNLDPAAGRTSVSIKHFSEYGAVAVSSATDYVNQRLVSANGLADIVVKRPQFGGMRTTKPNINPGTAICPNVVDVDLRARSDVGTTVQGLVVHSTNSGNSHRTFNGELGWATNDCNLFFTHFYINKDGSIYQVADTGLITNHIGPTYGFPSLGLNNDNAVGIELFNNVGEPYDGRQLAALVRLLDFLLEQHELPRPSRDPTTGTYRRNTQHISTGGDRIIMHNDYSGKCDPVGFLRSATQYFPLRSAPAPAGCSTPAQTIAGAPANAPALIDGLYDALAMLDRRRQHTGVINSSGGDALGSVMPGGGGNVRFLLDATAVGNVLGNAVPLLSTENAPLIIGPGITRNNLTGVQTFSDVIIAGSLEVAGNLDLRVPGTIYLAPNGKIVLRSGVNGGQLTIRTRGTPILQGLVDTRGESGQTVGEVGGDGGAIEIVQASSGVQLIPTIISRGGDSDSNPPASTAIVVTGGRGGNVTLALGESHAFLGGGVGPRINDVDLPPIRSGAIDPSLLLPPNHVGDFLPPPPPFTLSSPGVVRPVTDQRVPLIRLAEQPGFTRGFLTSGGMGGVSAGGTEVAGAGGDGGNITVQLAAEGTLSLRDVDFITGAEVEAITYRFFLPETELLEYVVFPVTGSLGGVGSGTGTRGGDGGAGGKAGDITFHTVTISPPPTAFSNVYGIKAFPSGLRLQSNDAPSPGTIEIGNVYQATDISGNRLYRSRVTPAGGTVGGVGGIPGGRPLVGQFPGRVGAQGTSGTISGLRVR